MRLSNVRSDNAMMQLSDRRRHALATVLALGLAATASDAASGATVHAQLRAPGAAWLSDGKPDAPRQATMRNVDKSFVPDILVVPVGSTILFPNDDPFYHSIYSLSKADPFDIGFYDTGPGKIVPFTTAGVVLVSCHIHASMRATILVVDGPEQQSAGAVRFDDVPGGTFVLHAWSEALGERTTTVQVNSAKANVTLPDAL